MTLFELHVRRAATEMVFRWISLMILRTLSKFSSVPRVEGQPEHLQALTEKKNT
jgi:hypothetical protein